MPELNYKLDMKARGAPGKAGAACDAVTVSAHAAGVKREAGG